MNDSCVTLTICPGRSEFIRIGLPNWSVDEGKKLKAGKKYFFRIGAVATDLGDGVQEKFNYAPVVGITM